jgi:anthranilate phosphoribosyltransferase
MSSEFRELLKKIGSGTHSHKNLTFEEASLALEMMLKEIATPAQIGAFLIAHRIKRPTAEELGGMLHSYNKLGVQVETLNSSSPLIILGIPYDGRTRTAPISPITALILSSMNLPVLMHGGTTMPTKYGLNLAEIWSSLDVDVTQLSIKQVNQLLQTSNFGFLYLPNHHPLAHNLVTYREQIGKRPPLATLELIWHPYQGETHLIAGYVHPPTETTIKGALKLNGKKKFTLIKGLEGSGDLKLSQTNIITIDRHDTSEGSEYLKIKAQDYHLDQNDPILEEKSKYIEELHKTIQGKDSHLQKSAIFNGGFYLWRCGATPTIEEGIITSEKLLTSGKVEQQLQLIQKQLKASN